MKTIKLGDRVKTNDLAVKWYTIKKNLSGTVIGIFSSDCLIVLFDVKRPSLHDGITYVMAEWLKGYPKIKLQEGRCYWLFANFVTKIPLFKSWKGGKTIMPEYKVGDVVEVVEADGLDHLVGIYKGDKLIVRGVLKEGVFVDYKGGRLQHIVYNYQIKLVKREGE